MERNVLGMRIVWDFGRQVRVVGGTEEEVHELPSGSGAREAGAMIGRLADALWDAALGMEVSG